MNRKQLIINKIVKLAQANFPNSEIFLYGSRARNDSRKDSDWDLLVLLNTTLLPFSNEQQILDDFYELELESGEIFSPLIYTKSDWENKHFFTPLYENIQNEGIRIK
ncbi:MAG: nucleotidyltransferase domain-containing protein [Petrimonas sp.]|nr:nucleotidyltransferase domain-containing protein [Petrimonas sp.]